MKVLFIAIVVAVFLCILWGPAFVVARKLQRKGDAAAFRWLRVIFPSQLLATGVLVFIADEIGLANPAVLLVGITCGVAAIGAFALATLRYLIGVWIR